MKNNSTKVLRMKAAVAATVVICSLYTIDSSAQWATNPYLNNAICTAGTSQSKPVIASDGSGGAIIAWVDSRVTGEDIYAQRIDVNGVIKWTTDGIAICSAPSLQAQVAIISDGNGGAIITWTDFRNGVDANIYAQRVNGSGVLQWAADGVAICSDLGDQTYPILTSDGNGGAVFTWTDYRGTPINHIYAQGINANGTLKWPEVDVCTAPQGQGQPAIISDGSGGAIITWLDARNGLNGTSAADIYAQRIGANGLAKWTPDGVSICEAYRMQSYPAIASDGSGGAIIAWQDERNLENIPSHVDIYAQRINGNGVVQWTANGLGICITTEQQSGARIISDQAGGAIIAWDNFTGSVTRILTQRINGSGAALWMNNGVPIGSGMKKSPDIVSDGNGGAFYTWEDNRRGSFGSDNYAQYLDANGLEVWRPFGGVVVSNAYGSKPHPRLVNDNSGGIIIVWEDSRPESNTDIYAQHVQADGTLGGGNLTADPATEFNPVISVFPNPVDRDLTIDASSISSESPVVVSLLDLTGRTLETISGNGVMQMTLDTYKPSAYILQLRYSGHIITKLIIKK
jgi:hypothetical protein